MTRIAILGAGGKMGCRLTDNLLRSNKKHELLLVDVSNEGKDRIAERGLTPADESDALEEAVRRGVPREAAEDFMFGHIKILLGVGFSRVPFPFSDGAQLIAGYGQERILKEGWRELFEPESVKEQVRVIVSGRAT